jgi:hypothetical protein
VDVELDFAIEPVMVLQEAVHWPAPLCEASGLVGTDFGTEIELVTPTLVGLHRGYSTIWRFDLVGSDQGAVSASQPVGFPGPSAEPDVRLSPHRALHVFMPTCYAASCVCVAHGEGITAPR